MSQRCQDCHWDNPPKPVSRCELCGVTLSGDSQSSPPDGLGRVLATSNVTSTISKVVTDECLSNYLQVGRGASTHSQLLLEVAYDYLRGQADWQEWREVSQRFRQSTEQFLRQNAEAILRETVDETWRLQLSRAVTGLTKGLSLLDRCLPDQPQSLATAILEVQYGLDRLAMCRRGPVSPDPQGGSLCISTATPVRQSNCSML